MDKVKKSHYVDNAKLYEHMVQRRAMRAAAVAAGKEPPTLQNDRYLGQTILDVATNLTYRPNFINYSYKADMISDAVENLVRVIDNFNPEKSKYPFAYMTTVAWQAFVRRIQLEEKQQRIKGALIDALMVDDLFDSQDHDEDGIAYKTHFIDYLRENNFIGREAKPNEALAVKDPEGLEVFMTADVQTINEIEDTDEAEDYTSR
jgi:hypothetical protein